ncbi:VanZ family protein [Fictibacillus sp. WQ 8-8]|uniref:VanZ family protein n=1 Tax=Fictibacillus sp. WQ 8-8 TaxID=2938788 RepID=UPI00210B5DFE|nr:VanZ family protein [Fictibacillus sp. WQ 8-8]MCQ6264721.1 VanZ family protein [Fictibacillus sp. WQ 8-8]
MNTIKLLSVIAWALFLGLHTFTDSLEALLYHQKVNFTWDASPDLLSFFNLSDLTMIHQYFYIVKFGHFAGFAIMDLLLFSLLRKHRPALVLSVGFAVFTETVQLYMGRDGRLYDVVIDSLGILIVYLLLKPSMTNKEYKESSYL